MSESNNNYYSNTMKRIEIGCYNFLNDALQFVTITKPDTEVNMLRFLFEGYMTGTKRIVMQMALRRGLLTRDELNQTFHYHGLSAKTDFNTAYAAFDTVLREDEKPDNTYNINRMFFYLFETFLNNIRILDYPGGDLRAFLTANLPDEPDLVAYLHAKILSEPNAEEPGSIIVFPNKDDATTNISRMIRETFAIPAVADFLVKLESTNPEFFVDDPDEKLTSTTTTTTAAD